MAIATSFLTSPSVIPASSLSVRRYRRIDDVPACWDVLAPTDKVGLERAHLTAVERSQINNIQPHYIVVYDNSTPVGIAHCFIIRMDLSALGEEIPRSARAVIKHWYPDFMDFKLLEGGFPANTGQTIAVAEEKYWPALIEIVGMEYEDIAIEANAAFIFIRDVPHKLYQKYQQLTHQGYVSSSGFPNARLQIQWDTFDEYLSALRNKKRHNIRKKMRRLNQPEISVDVVRNFSPHAERLARLWANVSARRTDYQHETLTPDYFRAIDKYLGARSHIIAIKRHEEIVAFALVLEGDTEYCWLYVGLDYEQRDRYDLYFNLLFQGILGAIESRKKVLDLGVTAYEYKMFIGAELEPYSYFLKYTLKRPLTKALASMFMKGIRQPTNPYRTFKASEPRTGLSISGLQCAPKQTSSDVFQSAYDYTKYDELKVIDMYPMFPAFEAEQGAVVRYEGRDVIMLGSNSYLGLNSNSSVKQASKDAVERFGTGCSGSPLLNGTMSIHLRLQNKLAEFVRKEQAVIFSTGYQTNVGTLSLLCNSPHVVVISDERNHASLIDGLRMSKCRKCRFKHNDMEDLERHLAEFAGEPTLVVVDSLFSMEGTLLDLTTTVRLCKTYGARLMLDESHAIGVFGPNGRGVAEHFGLLDEIDLVMGTFSKALAAQGGFIAGEVRVMNWIRHEARGHVFSANLAPPIVAAVEAALKIVITEPERRISVRDNAAYFYKGLLDLGFQAVYSGGAIVSVFIGVEILAVTAFKRLFDLGCYVNPVIFPAVPKGEELLRISFMPTHTKCILDRALCFFGEIRTPGFP